MTQHTTKKDLSQALSKLHKSVRQMIAQEVNCVVYKGSRAVTCSRDESCVRKLSYNSGSNQNVHSASLIASGSRRGRMAPAAMSSAISKW